MARHRVHGEHGASGQKPIRAVSNGKRGIAVLTRSTFVLAGQWMKMPAPRRRVLNELLPPSGGTARLIIPGRDRTASLF